MPGIDDLSNGPNGPNDPSGPPAINKPKFHHLFTAVQPLPLPLPIPPDGSDPFGGMGQVLPESPNSPSFPPFILDGLPPGIDVARLQQSSAAATLTARNGDDLGRMVMIRTEQEPPPVVPTDQWVWFDRAWPDYFEMALPTQAPGELDHGPLHWAFEHGPVDAGRPVGLPAHVLQSYEVWSGRRLEAFMVLFWNERMDLDQRWFIATASLTNGLLELKHDRPWTFMRGDPDLRRLNAHRSGTFTGLPVSSEASSARSPQSKAGVLR